MDKVVSHSQSSQVFPPVAEGHERPVSHARLLSTMDDLLSSELQSSPRARR